MLQSSNPTANVAVEVLDGLLEAVALDEPHGVIGPPAAVGAQAVDRDDARVLQSACDFGLDDESPAADGIVGVLLDDLLERHLAVQLGIQGHENLAQPAACVRPQDAEPLAVAGGRAQGQTGGALGVVITVALGGGRRTGTAKPAFSRQPGRAKNLNQIAAKSLGSPTWRQRCLSSPRDGGHLADHNPKRRARHVGEGWFCNACPSVPSFLSFRPERTSIGGEAGRNGWQRLADVFSLGYHHPGKVTRR